MTIKKLFFLFCVLFLFAEPVFCEEEDKIVLEPADEEYLALLEKVKSGDKTVDFLDLRMLYSQTQFYIPYADETRKKIRLKVIEVFKKGKYEKTLKLSEEVFEKDYMDMNMHYMCMMSYNKLENKEMEAFHKFVLNALIDSIVSFGDGRSAETAYKVISTREEEFILTILGYVIKRREEVRTKNHALDKIFTSSLDGNKNKILYFNKDVPNKWLNKKYSGEIDPTVEPKKKSKWQKFKDNYITYEGLD